MPARTSVLAPRRSLASLTLFALLAAACGEDARTAPLAPVTPVTPVTPERGDGGPGDAGPPADGGADGPLPRARLVLDVGPEGLGAVRVDPIGVGCTGHCEIAVAP